MFAVDRTPPSPASGSGYIRLELPVFHIGYFKNTVQILQCICKSCSRVLLPEEERKIWLKWVRGGQPLLEAAVSRGWKIETRPRKGVVDCSHPVAAAVACSSVER